jgi:hypothetical protein
MNIRNWLILGLALVLAFTLTVGLPRVSQAQQQKDPAVDYGPGGQKYASGYYGSNGSGYTYCPMGPGYEYSAPARQDNRNYAPRSWGQSYQGARPWNGGYASGYRGGRGYCW